MTDAQREDFERITRPVIEWMNKNTDPHAAIVVSTTHACLYSGEIAFETFEYVKD